MYKVINSENRFEWCPSFVFEDTHARRKEVHKFIDVFIKNKTMIDFANFPLISTWQPGVLFAMINRIGEPETGVPTRYCPISTQDSKPQFYAATNYG